MSAMDVKKESGNPMVKKETSGAEGTQGYRVAPKRAKIVDFSLAEKWEDSRLVRELLRNQGRLVRWVSEKLINVINLETLGVNSTMMTLVAEHHCAQTKVVKAPAIDFLKAQVKGWSSIKTKHAYYGHI
jgi:hypothetical protein